MDINELRVGDWARLRYFDSITGKEVVKDFQVTSITTESPWHHRAVWSSEGNMGHEHIEGVPLTAEILEKNGFVREAMFYANGIVSGEVMSDDYHLNLSNLQVVVELDEYDKKTMIFYGDYQGDDDGENSAYEEWATYIIPMSGSVHQLQQALRLCGLHELANNFKV